MLLAGVRSPLPQDGRAYGRPAGRPYREGDLGVIPKGSPAQSMEARAPHDFEHDALVPGPGNAEHFSLVFTTWGKVKGGKGEGMVAFGEIPGRIR